MRPGTEGLWGVLKLGHLKKKCESVRPALRKAGRTSCMRPQKRDTASFAMSGVSKGVPLKGCLAERVLSIPRGNRGKSGNSIKIDQILILSRELSWELLNRLKILPKSFLRLGHWLRVGWCLGKERPASARSLDPCRRPQSPCVSACISR